MADEIGLVAGAVIGGTLGLYAAAWGLGITIPDNLSVVGFDDIENARWCCPPLTTVRQPLAEMAATATGMVLTMAAGGSPPQSRVEIGTTLVVRGSTAAPEIVR